MRLVLRTRRIRGLATGVLARGLRRKPPMRRALIDARRSPEPRLRNQLTEGHSLTVPQVPITDTFGSFNMAQRTLVRPVGLALNSARTQRLARPFSTVLDTPIDPKTQQATPPTRKSSVFEDAVNAAGPRTNWTREQIAEVYNTPLIRLTYAAVCLDAIGSRSSSNPLNRLRYISASTTQPLSRCVLS